MSNPYVDAVNNFNALIAYVEEIKPDFSDAMLDVLKYNVFILKAQPQYKGKLPDEQEPCLLE